MAGGEASLIHMAMVIRNLNDFSKIGYVLFGVSRSLFSADLQEQVNNLQGNAYIVTNDGAIVSAVRNIAFADEADVISSCLRQETDGALYQSVQLEGKRLLRIRHDTAAQDWTLLLVVPQRVVTADLRYMGYTSLALALAVACVTWLLTLLISSGISRPIIRIADAMKQFEQGDFSVRCREQAGGDVVPEPGADEIGYLSSSFDRMIEQLDHTVNQNYRLQLLEKDMEVRLLQAQLDPHFLYNTLDSIYYLAKEHGAEDISDIVLALCSLSRASITQTESLVSVAEDLAFARDYLKIMRLRFGSKLSVSFEVEEAALQTMIPKLTLQPLIANAIRHGLEHQSGSWEIRVGVRVRGGSAAVFVRDNGAGITPERLEQIRQYMAGGYDNCAHIGLCALGRRLRLLLGAQASLTISSECGKGTEVLLILPLGKRSA